MRATPRVEIEAVAEGSGARTKFIVTEGLKLDGSSAAILLPLEAGRYALRTATLRIPATDSGGQRWAAMELPLHLQGGVGTFALAEGEFLHLGFQDVDATLASTNGSVQASWSQDFRAAAPDAETWNATLAALVPAKRAYLRRAGAAQPVAKIPWEAASAAANPRQPGETAAQARSRELDALMPTLGFELRRCASAHLRKAEGKTRCEILVSAEGNFTGVTFLDAVWKANAPARACVENAFKAHTLSPADDGRAGTWTMTFEN